MSDLFEETGYVTFTAYGVPQPKGSGSKTKAGVYIEAGTKNSRKLKRSWANSVYEAAKAVATDPLDGPLFFSAEFYFAAPKAGKVAKRTYHDVRPDLDKLIRSVWDSMTKAGLIHDDARIAKIIMAGKRTIQDGSEPRVKIGIGRLWTED